MLKSEVRDHDWLLCFNFHSIKTVSSDKYVRSCGLKTESIILWNEISKHIRSRSKSRSNQPPWYHLLHTISMKTLAIVQNLKEISRRRTYIVYYQTMSLGRKIDGGCILMLAYICHLMVSFPNTFRQRIIKENTSPVIVTMTVNWTYSRKENESQSMHLEYP